MTAPAKHLFYSEDLLLFVLESADEYDTATPYRYAVNRFTALAERLQQGQSVTVVTRQATESTQVLQTIDELRHWVNVTFNTAGTNGFEQYLPSS